MLKSGLIHGVVSLARMAVVMLVVELVLVNVKVIVKEIVPALHLTVAQILVQLMVVTKGVLMAVLEDVKEPAIVLVTQVVMVVARAMLLINRCNMRLFNNLYIGRQSHIIIISRFLKIYCTKFVNYACVLSWDN